MIKKIDPRDVCTLAGIACGAAGAREVMPAAGWIVLGAGLFYVGALHPLILATILHRKRD